MTIVTIPEVEEGQGPVLMLNMLKFKDRSLYFDQYIPAFTRVVAQLGIAGVKVALVTDVVSNVIADEGETWDAIAMVEYPSAEAFKTIALSNEYRDIAEQLRLAALENLKLYMTRKTDF